MIQSLSLPLIVGTFMVPILAPAQNPVYPPLADFNQSGGAEVSQAFASEISRGATSLGNISSTHARAGWLGSYRANDRWTWLGGAEWRGIGFDRSSGSPIPREVHGVAAKLGADWNVSERWTLRLETDPGLYTDFEDVSLDDFNAPFGLRATYTPGPELTWVLGVNVDPRSGLPVIGGPGVRWRFAPEWTLSLILPRPRLEFAAMDSLTAFIGGELKGGSWRVADDFGQRRGEPRLDHEMVDYREIRVGGGVRWRVDLHWSLTFDAGWVVDRRFAFDREDVLLNGDGAPYLQVGALARF